jgi:hypothetical protein
MLSDEVHKAIVGRYPHCLATLSEITKDTNASRSLCPGSENFLDFDKVSECYCLRSDKPETVDMLANGRNFLVLVEFKSGKIQNKKDRMSIANKLLSSLLLLEQISCSCIEASLKKWVEMECVFVLVYDLSVNPRTQSTPTRIHEIVQHMNSQSIRFGLQKYNNLYAQVLTLSPHNFMTFITRYDLQHVKI